MRDADIDTMQADAERRLAYREEVRGTIAGLRSRAYPCGNHCTAKQADYLTDLLFAARWWGLGLRDEDLRLLLLDSPRKDGLTPGAASWLIGRLEGIIEAARVEDGRNGQARAQLAVWPRADGGGWGKTRHPKASGGTSSEARDEKTTDTEESTGSATPG